MSCVVGVCMEYPVQWECAYSVMCSGSVYGMSCVVGVCMECPV